MNFFAAARSRGEVYPKEREEANVRARMALVEIVRESRALAERSSDRGSVKGANGEKKERKQLLYRRVPPSLLSNTEHLCVPTGRARASQGESGTFGAGT